MLFNNVDLSKWSHLNGFYNLFIKFYKLKALNWGVYLEAGGNSSKKYYILIKPNPLFELSQYWPLTGGSELKSAIIFNNSTSLFLIPNLREISIRFLSKAGRKWSQIKKTIKNNIKFVYGIIVRNHPQPFTSTNMTKPIREKSLIRFRCVITRENIFRISAVFSVNFSVYSIDSEVIRWIFS